MCTRRLAQVYLITALVVGAGLWCFTAGTAAAASLAEISLPPVITFLGEGLGGLPWTILTTTAIAILAWPAVLGHARRHSWVSNPLADNGTNTFVPSAYADTTFDRLAGIFLEDGYRAEELIAVVNAVASQSAVPKRTARPLIPGYMAVYDIAPPELMTVTEVVDSYDVTRQTVFGWMRARHVKQAGLLLYSEAGQRQLTLLDRREVDDWVNRVSNGDIPIYDSVPDGMATLADAEDQLGINRRTIRAWIVRGHISKTGLLRGPARGGGLILVSPSDVRRFAESRSLKRGIPILGHDPLPYG